MASKIVGFEQQRIEAGGCVSLNVAVGGSGSPIVLLHGFPQTHLMWRHVAADLAADHTVICPDLRGYGDSDKPVDTGETYSKRTMAADIVAVARALGHDRFALVGHDRGALVAIRAALDHPDTITHLASLDVLPTLDTWDVMHGTSAAVGFHLYLMAQPPGLPEQMIAASADAFFGHFLDIWTQDPEAIPADMRADYLRSSREAVVSIVGRLPRIGRNRYRTRHGRPRGGQPAAHAGDCAATGLGRGARLRRCRPVAGLGAGAGAHHGRLRAFHGRRSTRRCRQSGTRPAGSVAPSNGRGSIANPPGFDVFLRLTRVRFTLIFWQTPYEGSVFTRE
jgi:pimeloyl-ACP methyl ester carboxylesterase